MEGLLLVALALVLRPLARRVAAGAVRRRAGAAGGREGPRHGLRRGDGPAFDPVNDWAYFGPGFGVLGDSIGGTGAVVTAVVVGLVVLALLVLMPLSVGRLTGVAQRHRRTSVRASVALAVVWVLCSVAGLQFVRGGTGGVVRRGPARVRRGRPGAGRASPTGDVFAREIRRDDSRDVPADQLLTGLRGKDVLLVFVESYGRVAVQDSDFSPEIDAVLDNGTRGSRAPATRRAVRSSPRRRSARLRGWRTRRCSRGCGWTASGATTSCYRGPADADQRVRAGGLAHGVRRTREHEAVAGRLGVLRVRRALRLHDHPVRRARSSATRTCPTSTRSRRSAGSSSPVATGRR